MIYHCFVAVSGAEILVCIISALISLRVAHRAKKEIYKKNEGTFSVQVLGEKDIIVHQTKNSGSYNELSMQATDSTMSAMSEQQAMVPA